MSAHAIRPSGDRGLLSIRVAEPDDRNAVLTVIAAANAEYQPLVPPEIFDLYLRDLHDLVVTRRDATIAVASCGRGIVGAVAFIANAGPNPGPNSRRDHGEPKGWATFRALSVDPAARGAGIGQRLVGWCIGEARQQEAPAIQMHSAVFQTTAHRLYDRLGFKRRPDLDLDATTGYRDIPPTPGVPHLLAFWKKLR
jgi:GNAT superfamily N-acetyltransferase